MLRLTPPRHARIVEGDIFEKRAGGAELNVASGVALMGLRPGIISRLPQNELGTFIKNRIYTSPSNNVAKTTTNNELPK